MIKLSVIIPIYNIPQDPLKHCLTSVKENISNMGNEVEVFLINDGSTEPHIEPMLEEETSDSRFHYIYKTNSGVSDTRNMGINMAQGEYITFLDADDYLEPDALSYISNIIYTIKPDFACFGFCYNDETGTNSHFSKLLIENEKKEALLDTIIDGNNSFGSKTINLRLMTGKVYRRLFLIDNRICFNVKLPYCEDAFFNFCCIAKATQIYIDSKIVYHYVRHPASATQCFTSIRMKNTPVLLSLWENTILEYYPNDYDVRHALSMKALSEIKAVRRQYFTHPHNSKSFMKLKSEMDSFLYQPIMKKWIKELNFTDAHNNTELKNIILFKFHLYWLFLLTEGWKRRKYK